MPRGGKSGPRQRHGSRKLIEQVFAKVGKGSTLSTAQVFEGVNKAAGEKVPEYSVRSALRTLLRRKILSARKRGRELFFTFGGSPAKAAAPKPAATQVAVEAAPIMATTETGETKQVGAVAVAVEEGPHKLAVGEALILHVGDEHIESVRNVHGQLVVERHPRKRHAKA